MISAEHGQLSAREIGDMLRLSVSAVRYWLMKLRQAGRVEATAENRNSPSVRYRAAGGPARPG